MHYRRGSFGILNRDDMEDAPLQLLDGGIEYRFQETYEFDNLKRPGYEGYLFQCTLSGEGYFEKSGEGIRLTQGRGFLAKMPEDSRYWLDSQSKGWELAYLHFTGSAAASFYQKIEDLCGGVFRLREDSHVLEMIVNLQRRLLGGDYLRKYEGGKLTYEFLCTLLTEIESPSIADRTKSGIVNEAVRIMEEEYASLSGVFELAERIGVSWEHLTRSFRREMGCAPVKYLTQLRLQAAMNTLLNTGDTIEEVAGQNGFANGNYFNKVFRKHTGLTPTQYRRQRGKMLFDPGMMHRETTE